MDDLGPISSRTRSKMPLDDKNIFDIEGVTNKRKEKSLNQHFQKIGDKNNLEECISEISDGESDNYCNENGARNDNNLKINPNNKNTAPNNILNISDGESDNYRNENDASKANGTTRKVVGGILAGVGTAGAIASAAALIKVGAAGIVAALAGLIGACAAPIVAFVAIPVVLVALTAIGIFLLSTKASSQMNYQTQNGEIDVSDEYMRLRNK